MRRSLILACCLMFPVLCRGQVANVGLSLQLDHYPDFRLNRQSTGSHTPITFKLGGYNLDLAPVEYGAHFTLGYGPDVMFSYGVSIAYIHLISATNMVKGGVKLDRLQMRHTRSDDYVGGVIEDDLHDSAQLYLEYEHQLGRSVALLFNGGYRFVRSDTQYLDALKSERELEGGGTIKTFESHHEQHYYGAGFTLGLGLRYDF